jgi:hypothetical protein
MVNSIGSTTPVYQFSLKGPAPVLYLDLPNQMGQYSYGSSNWFSPSAAGSSLFSVSSPGIFTSDGEYWLSPTPEAWDSAKSLGDWHVNASYGWWDLVIIYGGGAPVTTAQGSTTVNFSVTQKSRVPLFTSPISREISVVPEPMSALTPAIGAGILAMLRRVRR